MQFAKHVKQELVGDSTSKKGGFEKNFESCWMEREAKLEFTLFCLLLSRLFG